MTGSFERLSVAGDEPIAIGQSVLFLFHDVVGCMILYREGTGGSRNLTISHRDRENARVLGGYSEG